MRGETEAILRRPPGRPSQTGYSNADRNARSLALIAGAASSTQVVLLSPAPQGCWVTFQNNGTAEITIGFGGADGAATLGAPDANSFGIAANGGKEEWWVEGDAETNFRAFCTVNNTLKWYRSS